MNISKPQKYKNLIVIYGDMGVGKTTFASTLDNPIFIRTEDGNMPVDPDCFDLCKSVDDVIEKITWLYKNDHDYKTVVIDSISKLDHMITTQLLREGNYGKNDKKIFAKISGFIIEKHKRILNACNKLRKDKDMTVVFLGHQKIIQYDNEESNDDFKYIKVSLDLYGKSSKLYVYECDIVGCLRIVKNIEKSKTKKNGVVITKEKCRELILGGDPFYDTKKRNDLQDVYYFDDKTENPLRGEI